MPAALACPLILAALLAAPCVSATPPGPLVTSLVATEYPKNASAPAGGMADASGPMTRAASRASPAHAAALLASMTPNPSITTTPIGLGGIMRVISTDADINAWAAAITSAGEAFRVSLDDVSVPLPDGEAVLGDNEFSEPETDGVDETAAEGAADGADETAVEGAADAPVDGDTVNTYTFMISPRGGSKFFNQRRKLTFLGTDTMATLFTRANETLTCAKKSTGYKRNFTESDLMLWFTPESTPPACADDTFTAYGTPVVPCPQNPTATVWSCRGFFEKTVRKNVNDARGEPTCLEDIVTIDDLGLPLACDLQLSIEFSPTGSPIVGSANYNHLIYPVQWVGGGRPAGYGAGWGLPAPVVPTVAFPALPQPTIKSSPVPYVPFACLHPYCTYTANFPNSSSAQNHFNTHHGVGLGYTGSHTLEDMQMAKSCNNTRCTNCNRYHSITRAGLPWAHNCTPTAGQTLQLQSVLPEKTGAPHSLRHPRPLGFQTAIWRRVSVKRPTTQQH